MAATLSLVLGTSAGVAWRGLRAYPGARVRVRVCCAAGGDGGVLRHLDAAVVCRQCQKRGLAGTAAAMANDHDRPCGRSEPVCVGCWWPARLAVLTRRSKSRGRSLGARTWTVCAHHPPGISRRDTGLAPGVHAVDRRSGDRELCNPAIATTTLPAWPVFFEVRHSGEPGGQRARDFVLGRIL